VEPGVCAEGVIKPSLDETVLFLSPRLGDKGGWKLDDSDGLKNSIDSFVGDRGDFGGPEREYG
jgi:hypothetical protein